MTIHHCHHHQPIAAPCWTKAFIIAPYQRTRDEYILSKLPTLIVFRLLATADDNWLNTFDNC